MTAIDTTLRTTGFTIAPRATRFVETLIHRGLAMQKRRATRLMLERLTDRELNDIGLTRGDICRRF